MRAIPAALFLALGAGCGPAGGLAGRPAPPPAPVVFRDVTESAGIRFLHVNGASRDRWLPETMGSGCAFLDADNDGNLDLFLVDSTSWPGSGGPAGRSRLYRNAGGGRFADWTERLDLPAGLFGMAAAAGDYDNDGWTDLVVTALGGSRLLRNEGGKRFRDVTRAAGLHTPGWPTGAAWLDYDRDGRLDLFVCHYVRWTRDRDDFSLDGTRKSYARPDRFPGRSCQLLRNEGGRFRDVSAAAGVDLPGAKALGVALCDFDRDGWPDLAVSNDTVRNFLFHNQGTGRFKEVAVQAGVAVAEAGRAKAGMGIDAADYGNDGLDGVLITNFSGEQISLYRRDGSGLFMDVAARAGIGLPSQKYLGFGAFFFDADLDGWLDVLVANGHIQDDIARRSSEVQYRQPGLLFRGASGGRFQDASAAAGALAVPRVARGAAWGDVDNDGDLDVLITTNGGAPALLQLVGKPANNWLRLRLVGRSSNRSAIGAMVRVRAGGMTRTGMVRSGSSYLSQSDLRLTFGLGRETAADEVEVRWPNGSVERFGALAANRDAVLVEGDADSAGGR